ncbi:SIT4 phosphatase-associated protein-domain-containing protein [Kockovaella imperatae]|uniref:SIT4 phosphatase-associated protein-domain-containing protein n=1 Tax=Kockovaella imperatae TaxID=4999 RepID=A0A1Y1UK30_9TREE|nr:SIT4 phosphatase-associated protein-domain-containing protein [Kockovaella imperatae]ORX38413.1 SIT4 phosphatase-associated protein-domain-containing protein [Kockovaella imperatae]
MLWRFGYASTSSIDSLLNREPPPSMEELMNDQDILSECKAMNQKLMHYLGSKDAVKSLLHWVIVGLDDLDSEAALADSQLLDHAMNSSDVFPAYRPASGTDILGTSPDSPPLEPAKMADESIDAISSMSTPENDSESSQLGTASIIGLGRGLERQQSSDELYRARFPLIATEILTSEMWTIGDCIMSNAEEILKPFWDAVLPNAEPSTPSTESSVSRQEITERERISYQFRTDVDEERDRKREMLRCRWARVNGHLLAKRPSKMIQFIQSLPNIVERLVLRLSSTATQDLLIRIIASEEDGVEGTPGVIDWLADEGLMPKLVSLLGPEHPPSLHIVAADILTSIITLCTPPAFNPAGGNAPEQPPTADGQQAQTPKARDNRLIRELVSEPNVSTMVGFMLDSVQLSDADWKGLEDSKSPPHPADPFIVHPLPSLASSTSSVSAICAIVVELIRRNNSDFSESHLFHTLRNRLMWIRMKTPEIAEAEEDLARAEMEKELAQCVAKHGIVHLGHILSTFSKRFGELHRLLMSPRTQARLASSENSAPLTLERFRVVELYAELLHSSNMSILNRPIESGPVYSSSGILSGGLEGLEALGEAIEADRMGDADDANPEELVKPARELPVSSSSAGSVSGSDVASDEEDLGASDDDDTPSPSPAASMTLPMPGPSSTPRARHVEPPIASPTDVISPLASPATEEPIPPPPSKADAAVLRNVMEEEDFSAVAEDDTPTPRNSMETASNLDTASNVAVAATTVAPSVVSEARTMGEESRHSNGDSQLAPGDRLKQIYITHRVLPTVIDLFFEYPNNNFLHHVVYDMLQQILNGRLGPGWNRELVIDLIKEAKLIERIMAAQKYNDNIVRQRGVARMACMGHVVLIAEELVKFFARCPQDLMDIVQAYFDPETWENFVEGSLRETKDKDTRPLAGGKPSVATGTPYGHVEEDSSDEEEEPASNAKFGEPLTRTKAQDGFAERHEDSFAHGEAEDDEKYWGSTGRRVADSSDEDEDDAGWLRPSVRNFESTNSDEEDFGAFQTNAPQAKHDDFDDDDAWGNFASSSSPSDADNPFADDNFATFTPSVPPAPPASKRDHLSLQHDPLTPHDWASQFDREFTDDLDPVPLDEAKQSPEVVPEDAGTNKHVVVPDMDDSPMNEKNSPWTAINDQGSPSHKAAGPSEWTLAGGAEDEGEDLPPTNKLSGLSLTAPPDVKEAKRGAQLNAGQSIARAPSPLPISVPPLTSSSPTLSAGILSPRRGSRAPTSPITIPQRSPLTPADVSSLGPMSPLPISSSPVTGGGLSSSPIRPGTSPSAIRPSLGASPSGSSHQRSSSFNSATSSPSRRVRRLSMGSPADKSLAAVATKEMPLGPGVSPDTQMTPEGLLQKTIDGRSVVVPADEIVRGVEEAQAERFDDEAVE